MFMEIERFDPNHYQQAALRTASNKDNTYALLAEGVMGLNGEAGECIDIVKKYLYQGHGLDRDHLAEELGDVAWYLAVSAHAIGWTLEDILKKNIEKLEKRYPDGFDTERSVNR
jgi:NTP pyrophosphatase (non-canonical NTP hydrolase)